ncbi:MAG: 30S ribosomal protein S6 [Patescibacteria group bacterium]
MKKYEIVYIIHPDLEGSTSKITEKVKSILKKSDGKILKEESWGKKKLAYEIGKNFVGIYEFLLVEMESASVKEVERTLRLSEEIIRSMVVQAEEEVEGKPRDMSKATKKSGVKPKETTVKEEKETVKKEVKEPKKTKVEKEKDEKERQKELDEKLQAIIGPDTES